MVKSMDLGIKVALLYEANKIMQVKYWTQFLARGKLSKQFCYYYFPQCIIHSVPGPQAPITTEFSNLDFLSTKLGPSH